MSSYEVIFQRAQHRCAMDRTENVWTNNFAVGTHASETCNRSLKNAASYDCRGTKRKKERKKKDILSLRLPRNSRNASDGSWGIARREFTDRRRYRFFFFLPPFPRFKPLSLVKGRRTGRYAASSRRIARMTRNDIRENYSPRIFITADLLFVTGLFVRNICCYPLGVHVRQRLDQAWPR